MVENGRRRLTSWKEIGAHLGRDVRTVLRWEKDRGLPVHRVPGATGRVVFAYTDELDDWSRGPRPKTPEPEVLQSESVEPTPATPVPTLVPASHPPAISRSHLVAMAALAIVAATGVVAWRVAAPKEDAATLTIAVTDTAIVATGADGAERWRHGFAPGEKAAPVQWRHVEPLGTDGVLVGTAYTDGPTFAGARGGELFHFSTGGRLRRRFSFQDRLQFGDAPYGPPWGMADFRAHGSGSARRVAVAAHHFEWWPSLVTILDAAGRRAGTFVNAGWVERLHWVAPDRLMIAGFSNAFDGAMIGLLDAIALDGQSPSDDPAFTCGSCGSGGPVRYIIMARSEVNRVTASPFNRVVLVVKPESIVARTIEVTANAHAADALYEFTPSLDLIRATYSDRYWELHRELESQGKITHTRQQCPDRDGPRDIRVWEPESGWSTVLTAPSSPAPSRR